MDAVAVVVVSFLQLLRPRAQGSSWIPPSPHDSIRAASKRRLSVLSPCAVSILPPGAAARASAGPPRFHSRPPYDSASSRQPEGPLQGKIWFCRSSVRGYDKIQSLYHGLQGPIESAGRKEMEI